MKLLRFPMFAAFFPTLRLCAYLMSLILLSAVPAGASAQTGGALPPAAQEAVDKGILAAKVPDYLLAVRYFEDARKVAPDAPVIYLNLGVAESKIPSRELRAIAWLAAYLAAVPNAPNAGMVKQQIAVLEVRNQSNASNLLRALQDMASRGASAGGGRDSMLRQVARLWARSGDIAAAFSIVDMLDANEASKEIAFRDISIAQAHNADVSGAKITANRIQGPDEKAISLTGISRAQIEAKDVRGARANLLAASQAAGLIGDPYYRHGRQNYVAQAQIEAGDFPAARETLLASLKSIDLIAHSNEIQVYRGDTYLLMQDIPSARSAFLSAYNNSKSIASAQSRSYLQSTVARSQAKAGDLANASQTISAAEASANLADNYKTSALDSVAGARVEFALAQIRAGDFAGANKTADLFVDGLIVPKSYFITRIDNALAAAQRTLPPKPTSTVSAWLKAVDSTEGYPALNSAPFLDLAGHVKSLPASDNPEKVFDGLWRTAEKLVGMQVGVAKMLRQQLAHEAP